MWPRSYARECYPVAAVWAGRTDCRLCADDHRPASGLAHIGPGHLVDATAQCLRVVALRAPALFATACAGSPATRRRAGVDDPGLLLWPRVRASIRRATGNRARRRTTGHELECALYQ